jgi:hypothetical protein
MIEVPIFIYELAIKRWEEDPTDTSLVDLIVKCETFNVIEEMYISPNGVA